jgi:hypothetical protein
VSATTALAAGVVLQWRVGFLRRVEEVLSLLPGLTFPPFMIPGK